MKFIYFLIGLILLALIIYAGFYTTNHAGLVIWFGVLTAIAAPLAFEFLFFPFKSKDNDLVQKLSRVPEIEKLINKARTQEAKVKILEQQKLDLDTLISFESQRRTLLAERAIYVLQGEKALEELERINVNLDILTKNKHKMPDSMKSLLVLIEKIETSDIAYNFFGKRMVLKKKYVEFLPWYGNLLFEATKSISNAIVKVNNPK